MPNLFGPTFNQSPKYHFHHHILILLIANTVSSMNWTLPCNMHVSLICMISYLDFVNLWSSFGLFKLFPSTCSFTHMHYISGIMNIHTYMHAHIATKLQTVFFGLKEIIASIMYMYVSAWSIQYLQKPSCSKFVNILVFYHLFFFIIFLSLVLVAHQLFIFYHICVAKLNIDRWIISTPLIIAWFYYNIISRAIKSTIEKKYPLSLNSHIHNQA